MDYDLNSLCICISPLHVLIARRIAEVEELRFSRGVYLAVADDEKQRYYKEVLLTFCDRVDYIVLRDVHSYSAWKYIGIWKQRVSDRLRYRQFGSVETVYVPSSLTDKVYTLLSAIQFSRLATYDDGQLNVNPTSPLWTIRTSLRARMLLLASGVCYWAERVRTRSSVHYSIYDIPNICSRVKHIRLIDETEAPGELGSLPGENRKFLLGPAPEAGAEVWHILRSAARRFNVNDYLPHPRAPDAHIDGVQSVDSQLIAEDYILESLRRNPNLSIQIYGYDSTPLLNLARTPRVQAFSLIGNTEGMDELKSLMEKSGVIVLRPDGGRV